MIRLFKRRKRAPKPLAEAELARRLTTHDYRCICCDEVVDAPNAVRLRAPFGWPDAPDPHPDSAMDELSGIHDILTENFARRNRDWLLRASLPLPVQGTEAHIFIGVWCSLPLGHFARFRSAQTRGEADQLGDMTSFLYSRLPADSGPLLTKGILVPQAGGLPPVYWITDERHPLYPWQHDGGIAPADAVELFRALGAEYTLEHLLA